MIRIHALIVLMFAGVTSAALAQAPACGPHGTPDTVLVSARALAARFQEPGLVVLAVNDGSGASYQHGHIPGALALDARTLWTHTDRLRVELAAATELARVMTGLGITPQSRIVLYPSGADDTSVSRAYWTLDAIGLGARTSILDGGLAAWTGAGQALERKASAPKSVAPFPPCLQRDLYADADYVKAHLHTPGVVIVDAREAPDYTGAMAMMGRRGHIPGAVNIPEPTLISDGRYLSLAELRQKFAAAGIKPGDTVVSYCHIGLMATEVYVAARALGYPAKMYDGSFQDWAAHADYQVEVSPGHPAGKRR